ncbi:hypothetical protein ACVWZV_000960 [Bradyrhizobium sp. GM5.1]
MGVLRVVTFAVVACLAAIGIAQAQDTTTLKKEMPGQWGALDHRAQQDLRRHAQGRRRGAGLQARAGAGLQGRAAFHQGHRRLERQGSRHRPLAGCER